MLSLFSLYHSVRTQPMWQDIWFINCYFVIGFRWKDDGKKVIASQAGSTVSTPHPQNWSLIGSHRWRGGKLSHFDRSFFCHNEMPTKIQRPEGESFKIKRWRDVNVTSTLVNVCKTLTNVDASRRPPYLSKSARRWRLKAYLSKAETLTWRQRFQKHTLGILLVNVWVWCKHKQTNKQTLPSRNG